MDRSIPGRHKGDALVWSRLDRVFLNGGAMNMQLAVQLRVVRTTTSDHYALSLRFNCKEKSTGVRSSRTKLWWFKEIDYGGIVEKYWRRSGGTIQDFEELQEDIKIQLQAWV